jgi:tRNA nucleotidyltransferase/poly(A) polymerase
MFYDPLGERVIDFVGGLEDLAGRRVRAIGRPRDRFAEDKLRMLRAVRFAAAFGFALDLGCRAAIAEMAAEIRVVSPERIAAEMRRLLADSSRAAGVRLLLETGLAADVLPEIAAGDDIEQKRLDQALKVLARLGGECAFPLALAALLSPFVDASAAEDVCRRWRLSNKETELTTWLVANSNALANAKAMRWSALQPILLSEDVNDLLTLTEAGSPTGRGQAVYCRRLLGEPREVLDPPPLVTGDDLLDCGIPSGPQYKTLLQRIRVAQLDGEIRSKAEALAMVEKLRGESSG